MFIDTKYHDLCTQQADYDDDTISRQKLQDAST